MLLFALVLCLLFAGLVLPAAFAGRTDALAWAEEQSAAEEGESAAAAEEGALTPLAVDEVTVGPSGNYPTPQEALNNVGVNGGNPWEMVLCADFTIDMITIGFGVNLTIKSESSASPHTLTASADNRHLYIMPGASLTLRDVVLTGGNPDPSEAVGGSVYVFGGEFIMQSGAVIRDNATVLGGAVFVTSPNPNDLGNFRMEGGTISGNSGWQGGAVYAGSTMNNYPIYATMTGGTISGNSSLTFGGGVAVMGPAIFTMTGGEISNNAATRSSDDAVGGGVAAVAGGSFTMNGGLISGNESGYYGGGVAVVYASSFTMNGGEISENSAVHDGGGVVVASPPTSYPYSASSFTMNGGTISDNGTEASGGGVALGQGSSFTMTNGEITGNTAAVYGGGVGLEGASNYASQFSLKGGSISNNSATDGGGVAVTSSEASLTLEGGTLSGNSASKDGGGIWYGNGGKIYLATGDSAAFLGNSAQKLYLPDALPQPVTGGDFAGTASSLSADFAHLGYPDNYPYANNSTVLAFNNYDVFNAASAYELEKVTFNAEGGSFSGGSPTTSDGVWTGLAIKDRMPLPPVRTGWTFIGWATSPGAQTPDFSNATTVSAPLTVYALWGHSVIYHGQGNTSGSVPEDSTMYSDGATVNVAAVGDLKKTDYNFIGWATSPTATKADYQPGDTFTITLNTDLYAVWQAVVPPTPPSPPSPTPASSPPSTPQTGDSIASMTLLVGALLALAALCIGTALRLRRSPATRKIGMHSKH
ncbi:MAG: InlB B-repeat-containing protein [Coriobacteriales bacterium]|nr:InlB B-repeat-containing protein [Coriobacteriales bacterium]